jgi:hypothetical protein
MNKVSKIVMLSVFLTGAVLYTFADRGIGKKKKAKITLNINTNNSFQKALLVNLKTGLKYKGSLLSSTQKEKSSIITSNLVTYQKGNTIYIMPFKQKMVVAETRQGYTGMKLIIKSH